MNTPEMLSQELQDELGLLIDASLHGDLTAEQASRLDQLVSQNPAANLYYVRYIYDSLNLFSWAGGPLPWKADSSSASEGFDAPDETVGGNQVAVFAGVSARCKHWLDGASRHPQAVSYAVAAATMMAIVAWMSVTLVGQWQTRRDRREVAQHPEIAANVEYVATLSNQRDDVWLKGTRPPKDDPRLAVGQRLVLKAGMIEIQYDTGVHVVIEGPADFIVGTEQPGAMPDETADHAVLPATAGGLRLNSGQLKRGKLVARVEGPRARGFTIETRNMRVEDIGTEFGIEVSADGVVRVDVLVGEVETRQRVGDGWAAQGWRLSEGQSLRVSPTQRIEQFPTESSRFASLRRQADLDQQNLHGARAVTEITWNQDGRNILSSKAATQNIGGDAVLVSFRAGSVLYRDQISTTSSQAAGEAYFYGEQATDPGSLATALADSRLDSGVLKLVSGQVFEFRDSATSRNDVLLIAESGSPEAINIQLVDRSRSPIGKRVALSSDAWGRSVARHDANTSTTNFALNAVAIPLGDFVEASQLDAVAGVRITNTAGGLDPTYIGIGKSPATQPRRKR